MLHARPVVSCLLFCLVLVLPADTLRAEDLFTDPDLSRSWIVRLATPAWPAPAPPGARRERRQQFRTQQDQVLERMRGAIPGRPGLTPRRRFVELLNGMSVTLSGREAEAIRKIPGVVAVEPDIIVNASLDESVPRIGAPSIWSGLGVRGAGILIAVIDTGIDYSHADLGGGIGPGFKVRGGYDFVSNDADPADDHGHGTHVAATAAGTHSTLTGVAPDASLLAYKALGADGSGLTSDVIAAVERALDPDQDPLTADGAQVITLSLGSPGGNPDDAGSMALDAAVDAGAIVIVSAGNNSAYKTIGTPGSSRKALTIGATTDSDTIATFSSRGYTPGYGIKPNVVAPGVSICAAWPSSVAPRTSCEDSLHMTLNGTSMAAPHAAGAAALLRQLSPALPAPAIQAILAERSVAVADNPLAAGAGRLDLQLATTAPAYALPSQVVFPPVDYCVAAYRQSVTLTLQNLSAQTKALAVTLEPMGPSAPITVTAPPALAASGQASIVLDIDTTSAAMTAVSNPPFGLVGIVHISVGGEDLRLPWFVPTSPRVEVRFDAGIDILWVHDTVNTVLQLQVVDNPVTIDLPQGRFDFIAHYGEAVVFKEGVDIGSCNPPIDLPRAVAVHNVIHDFTAPDTSAIPAASLRGDLRLWHAGGLEFFLPASFVVKQFSPASSLYSFEWHFTAAVPPQKVSMSGSFVGINADILMRTAAADFTLIELGDDPPVARDTPYLFSWRAAEMSRGRRFRAIDGDLFDRQPLTAPYRRVYGFTERDSSLRVGGLEVLATREAGVVVSPNSWVLSPVLFARPGGTIIGNLWGDTTRPILTWPVLDSRPLLGDLAPPVWFTRFTNSPTQLVLNSSWGQHGALWRTQTGWLPLGQGYAYTLEERSGNRTSTFLNAGERESFGPESLSLTAAGAVRLTIIGQDYQIDGTWGTATAVAEFDTTRADPDPPTLTGPWLFEDARPSDRFKQCPARAPDKLIAFDIEDATGFESLTLTIVSPTGLRRNLVLIGRGGRRYAADLPILSEAGLWDLEASATDLAGNRVSLALRPGFRYEVDPTLSPTLYGVKSGADGARLLWSGSPLSILERSTSKDLSAPVPVPGSPGDVVDPVPPPRSYYRLDDGSCR